ncbi:MAG: electron transfer flavoprotein subunit alpha/FixB family protein [Bacteroidetes bacterium]|nr:electron transfer flavoprotein subunit alpha/FixB family protein [Bacteroidota bacterium]
MSVLVYTENWDGKFKKLSFELVSYAKGIAKQMNTTVVSLSIGNVDETELKKLSNYGANKIISINNSKLNALNNQAYTSVIAQLVARENAEVVVFAHNNTGKAIAPRLSVRLKAGLVTGVVGIPQSTSPFVISKKIFTSKAFAKVTVKTPIRILTLLQNAFGVNESIENTAIEQFEPALNETELKTEVVEVNKVTGKILLTDADIVVSGGRGMKGPENWGAIEELAALLGAGTACSRPVSDEGWRPHDEHTGQTGKIIAPTLYIACGISGAIQHLGGISSSKCIVAINKDPDAPIFEAADYGIVGDVLKVLPDMITAVKELKAG